MKGKLVSTRNQQQRSISTTTAAARLSEVVSRYTLGLKQAYELKHGQEMDAATHSYPRTARLYLEWCLAEDQLPGWFSLETYWQPLSKYRQSALKKFMKWYERQAITRLLPDSIRDKAPAAYNRLALLYLSERSSLRGRRSRDTYTTALNQLFLYLDEQGFTFGLLGVKSFIDDMLHGTLLNSKGKPYATFTINSYLCAARDLARWILEKEGYIDGHQLGEEELKAVEGIEKVKVLPTGKQFYKDALSLEQREHLMAIIKDPEHAAMIALMVFLGLRTIEVTRLHAEDLNFRSLSLQVQRKGKHTKQQLKLFTNAVPYLQQYLAESGISRGPVFPGLNTRRVRYITTRYLELAGYKSSKVSAHSLRHTAAQIMLEKGFLPSQVQHQLGHSEYETTLYYTRKKEQELFFRDREVSV
ncbi:tyrosine-type recombinase/integrase [Cesiribacter sp. SM1]|uniref:tyrosine-type recombinase/integrase n=1 Tax=Cesiribacter sp. SM1 TaxID=2861196 RepID=UPI001CD42D79|nr:tyrosine-type recombinase/integrase [Cesiribacter sp. SM1]